MDRVTPRLLAFSTVFLAFSAWSTTIVVEHGYFGFLRLAATEPWGGQMFVDLVIALSLVFAWLRRDAAKHGIAAWPYFLVTLALGSIGPLAYLVHREWRSNAAAPGAAAQAA